MCPMINEYHTPFINRDVAAGGMGLPFEFDPTLMGTGSMCGPMGGYGVGGFYNTNYLGGVTMQPKLNQDTVHIIRAKDNENNNGLKKFGIATLALLGFGIVRCCFKGKGKTSWFKNILNKFKKPSTSTTATSSGKVWYNPLTWFKKSGTAPASTSTPTP